MIHPYPPSGGVGINSVKEVSVPLLSAEAWRCFLFSNSVGMVTVKTSDEKQVASGRWNGDVRLEIEFRKSLDLDLSIRIIYNLNIKLI